MPDCPTGPTNFDSTGVHCYIGVLIVNSLPITTFADLISLKNTNLEDVEYKLIPLKFHQNLFIVSCKEEVENVTAIRGQAQLVSM